MQHIWIFQLAGSLNTEQKQNIRQGLDHLLREWNAHGTPVPGQAEITYDRFVVVQATPGQTSGCSIDSMNRGVGEILDKVGATRLESNFVFYRDADGGISYLDFRKVKTAVEHGLLKPDTVVFDNTLGQINELSRWEMPLRDTWLARFLPAGEKA